MTINYCSGSFDRCFQSRKGFCAAFSVFNSGTITKSPHRDAARLDGLLFGLLRDGLFLGDLLSGFFLGDFLDGFFPGDLLDGFFPGDLLGGFFLGDLLDGFFLGDLLDRLFLGDLLGRLFLEEFLDGFFKELLDGFLLDGKRLLVVRAFLMDDDLILLRGRRPHVGGKHAEDHDERHEQRQCPSSHSGFLLGIIFNKFI